MAQAFAKIAQIDPKDQSTWMENLFLTFDLDWAHDAVIEDTMALVADAGVAATLFATHFQALPKTACGADLERPATALFPHLQPTIQHIFSSRVLAL